MEHLQNLFSRYERILIFDTETTGLNFQKDEIIQFSAVLLEQQNGEIAVTQQYDRLIQLAPGQTVPPEIQRLTGITTEMVMTQGIPRQQAAAEIGELIGGNTLLTAYNAHFDLSFLYYLLARHGDPACLKGQAGFADGVPRPAGLSPPAVQRHRGLRLAGFRPKFPPGGRGHPGNRQRDGCHGR